MARITSFVSCIVIVILDSPIGIIVSVSHCRVAWQRRPTSYKQSNVEGPGFLHCGIRFKPGSRRIEVQYPSQVRWS